MSKNKLYQMLLVLAFACIATGCVKQRIVTTVKWKNPDVLYMSYSETDGFSSNAKVQKCHRLSDNTMVCREQDDLNAVLNR